MGLIRPFRSHPGLLVPWLLAVVLLALHTSLPAAADEDLWADLKGDIFGDREIRDGADWLALEAPYRAEDAAIVPISVVALRRQEDDSYIKSITLVIDQNPAPVAAVIGIGPRSGLAAFSTRVRVNAYSHVRAIAETSSGELLMVSKFVKASGGCSAPAGKDPEAAMASLGKMRLRQFAEAADGTGSLDRDGLREAQLMIRHPNYSGLQMDQITRNYTPAHFVRDIEVRLDDDLLLTVEGAISLSEDPSLRFYFEPQEASTITARIVDTEEQIFSKSWDLEAAKAPES